MKYRGAVGCWTKGVAILVNQDVVNLLGSNVRIHLALHGSDKVRISMAPQKGGITLAPVPRDRLPYRGFVADMTPAIKNAVVKACQSSLTTVDFSSLGRSLHGVIELACHRRDWPVLRHGKNYDVYARAQEILEERVRSAIAYGERLRPIDPKFLEYLPLGALTQAKKRVEAELRPSNAPAI